MGSSGSSIYSPTDYEIDDEINDEITSQGEQLLQYYSNLGRINSRRRKAELTGWRNLTGLEKRSRRRAVRRQRKNQETSYYATQNALTERRRSTMSDYLSAQQAQSNQVDLLELLRRAQR